jgi:hypothetical protein
MSAFEDLKGWLATPWGWLIIWIPVLALFVAIALIGNAADWAPWEPNLDRMCFYREEQRELVRTGSFFLQVANFWSNFAYLAVGLLILFRSGSFIGRGTGLAFVFLAFGSGYYHGTLTELGQFLDIAGIYIALLALLFHGIIESFDLETSTDRVRNWFWFLVVCGMYAGFSKGLVQWHKSEIVAIFLGALIGILMIYWFFAVLLIGGGGSKDFSTLWGPFALALISFAGAAFFKYGDMTDLDRKYQCCKVTVQGKEVELPALESCPKNPPGYLVKYKVTVQEKEVELSAFETCVPKDPPGYLVKPDDSWAFGSESILQGHALWHIFSAFGMLCIFEFFTSLRRQSGSIRPWRSWYRTPE